MTLAITTYQWFLSIHILAAVVWVGGGVALHALFQQMDPRNDPQGTARFMQQAGFLGNRVFAPSSIILVAMGFALMANGDLDYDGWVIFGILVWLFSFAVGAGYLGRKVPPLGMALATEGFTPAVEAGWRTFRLLARIDTALLVLVVLDMALKPGS